MPRYSLRTLLLIVLIVGPLLAWGWGYVERVIEERRAAERAAVIEAERARVEEQRARTIAYFLSVHAADQRWRRQQAMDRGPILRDD